jgi:hypothetical protein
MLFVLALHVELDLSQQLKPTNTFLSKTSFAVVLTNGQITFQIRLCSTIMSNFCLQTPVERNDEKSILRMAKIVNKIEESVIMPNKNSNVAF